MVDDLKAVGWGIGEEGRPSRKELGGKVGCTLRRPRWPHENLGVTRGGVGSQLSQ